ncbi:TylF/MycF/NovP-related O-methyltransferase [Sediminibacterium soli]|uniref:TylF/MycF/NovP-related O-methyltransferase n=1 Tax=Sediminibacterium soli TaxID=2698829 RepID=UPI00137988C9|nr:TylF/MycF/NovP-related O-methyltransferase [Sediminibacterium soli]NCI45270.1 macrocin O-methyltransferase [Sediminibacterium soli]
MKRTLIALNAFCKHLILLLRPHAWLGFLRNPLLFFSNTLALSRWIARQPKTEFNDFPVLKRNYNKRYDLYRYVAGQYSLLDIPADYLEFGVFGGRSFEWWVKANTNSDSRFYGFDTFEGLPEKWGVFFGKGDMYADVPSLSDHRAKFVKGLFQDTLVPFLQEHPMHNNRRKIIHLDADLFSSTLFALSTLYPYLKKGDILFFDEFNVPNHEFQALRIFTEAFYVQTELVGAVNNYYQVAVVVI